MVMLARGASWLARRRSNGVAIWPCRHGDARCTPGGVRGRRLVVGPTLDGHARPLRVVDARLAACGDQYDVWFVAVGHGPRTPWGTVVATTASLVHVLRYRKQGLREALPNVTSTNPTNNGDL